MLLVVVAGAAAVLVPWTVFLSATLPTRYDTGLWRWSWVGFDVALVGCFAAAAWLGWRRRRAAVTLMTFTAAMLCCDAWFDVTLGWGSPGHWSAVALAVLVELPVAGLLLARAHVLLTGGMVRREFTVADIELHTRPEYQRLQEALATTEPATTEELADALSCPADELSPMLDRLLRAERLRRGRDGRWRRVPQSLMPPALERLSEADQARLRAFYDEKYDYELRLFDWAVRHRDEFGSWAQGSRGNAHLTEAELAEFNAEYEGMFTRYCLLRSSPAPGTRHITVRWYAFPTPEHPLTAPAHAPQQTSRVAREPEQ
ncbi:hypothetical protein SAMN05444320_12026 [Streptoalloteichus hindustanus]|uniref:HTH iclR-type domain-containing protein n=1 Tax=Streptoalloteichus hindustanus TaxID=2017 RepID=A0A1M5PXC9_STRHI|nr:hypothetical protein SAMN05444320_12026 [Streptoalloteichus hindustanus]